MNNNYMNSCGCEKPQMPSMEPHKNRKSLAMAYVPWQKWENVTDACSALKQGTIFDDLVLSFEGVSAACSSFTRRNSGNNNQNYYRRGMR